MTASPRTNLVVRFRRWIDPVFDRTIEARAGTRLLVATYEQSPADLADALAEASVMQVSAARDEVPAEWRMTGELIARCPNLLCASSSGAGYDTIDVPACTRAGIAVVNQSGGNAVSVAEHTMGLLLSVTHRLTQSDRWLRTRRGFKREDLMGHEIAGTTMGLVGIGHIGTKVAALAKAFGMKVIATDPFLEPAEIERRGAVPVSLDELLAQADIVSLHCPRDASTMNLIAAPQFSRMKPGAVFLSTARGGIHDEAALLEALEGGHLAGAGLDVWSVEPPPLDSRLLQHEAVVSTYHTAGVTHEARRNMARIAAEQIVDVLDGRRPPRLLNPEVWDRVLERRSRLAGG